MVDVKLLRRQSRWFGRLTLILLVLTALVAIAFTVMARAILAESNGPWTDLLAWLVLTWSPTVFYLYARRSGVDRVLDQLFYHRCRALDHLASRDLICERIGQDAYLILRR